MGKTILSKKQKQILEILSKIDVINSNFYLTGGTALAEFYLHHRYSEDLDFFSEDEFEIQPVISALKTIQKKAQIKFDWYIDYLQLGAQFLKVSEVKDYPRMIIKVKDKEWQEFFINEAQKFKKNILK